MAAGTRGHDTARVYRCQKTYYCIANPRTKRGFLIWSCQKMSISKSVFHRIFPAGIACFTARSKFFPDFFPGPPSSVWWLFLMYFPLAQHFLLSCSISTGSSKRYFYRCIFAPTGGGCRNIWQSIGGSVFRGFGGNTSGRSGFFPCLKRGTV